MKYYIILVSILSTLIFSGSLIALSHVVHSQQEQVQYITQLEDQYQVTDLERGQAVYSLLEIQQRINAVKEALK